MRIKVENHWSKLTHRVARYLLNHSSISFATFVDHWTKFFFALKQLVVSHRTLSYKKLHHRNHDNER